MRVVGLPYWGVHVKPGDILRSNATYDTTHPSSYENMGIAIALLAPDDANGPTAPGVDPFDPAVASDDCAGVSEPRHRGGQAVHARHPDARPPARERQLRRAVGHVGGEEGHGDEQGRDRRRSCICPATCR